MEVGGGEVRVVRMEELGRDGEGRGRGWRMDTDAVKISDKVVAPITTEQGLTGTPTGL